MDEDIRHRIQRAFGQSAGYQFANHWYKCKSCGEKFFIGECSKPMQEAACPGCNAKIGGTSHRPTDQTEQDEAVDTSPPGYTLPKAAEDEKQLFFRDVHAASARVMRVLIHGAMVCGLVCQIPDSSSSGNAAAVAPPALTRSQSRKNSNTPDEAGAMGADMPHVYLRIVNTGSMCTLHKELEATYICDHFYQDWRLLADNLSSHSEGVAMGMHNLLIKITKSGPDSAMKKKTKQEHWWDQQHKKDDGPVLDGSGWDRLSSLQRRAAWEETADEKYIMPFIAKFEEQLASLHGRWSSKEDESGPLVAEIREQASVSTFPAERRKQEMPQVWAFRAQATLSELHRRLPQAKKEHDLTVLNCCLQTQILDTLKALRTLPSQFAWHSMCHQRFSGRITRDDARETTVGQVLESQGPTERTQWQHSYKGLEEAWHEAFAYVDRFECLEIPAHLKTFYITKESSLICAIADEKDLGICPLVLTQWLVSRHNDVVQAAAIASGYPIRKASSATLGHHDIIDFDKDAMMRFVRDRCVTHTSGGRLSLDFPELERHLRHEFSRPEISFQLRLFQWLGEESTGSNELMSLIPQRELSPEVETRLKAEVRTPVQAAAILQKVQMAATFIVNSRDSLNSEKIAEMRLSEYLTTVLAESCDSIPSSTARTEVLLCHVDAFVRLVRKVIHSDPMEVLSSKYKAVLGKDLEAKLRTACEAIPDRLEFTASVLERMVDDLKDGSFSEDTVMTEWLCTGIEYRYDDAECAEAVQKNFPSTLQLKHWEQTYRVVKAMANAGTPQR